jgi:SprT protein
MSSLLRDYVLENLARQLLREVGARKIAQNISVYWNRRLKTTAGLACYERKAVFLNPKIIEVAPREVQRTLRHELAHFVAHERHERQRIQPHGPEWRRACRDLGIPNESCCHDLPLKPRRLPRRYFYECRECGNSMARVRKLDRPVACLPCCRRHNGGHYHERFRFVVSEESRTIAA